MKIWVVTGDYPSEKTPGHGIFVRDQVEALRAAGHSVRVLHAPPPTLRPLANEARPRVRAMRERLAFLPVSGGRTRADAARSQIGPDRAEASGPSRNVSVEKARAVVGRGARVALGTARVLHDQAGNTVAVSRLIADLNRALAAEGRPDVVHAHNVFPAGIAAAQWAGRRSIPYVVTEHMSAYLRHQYSAVELAEAIRVLDRAAAVVAVSSAQAEALPIPTDRVTVVPNVVPTEQFRLRDAQARTSGTVLAAGWLTPNKRMDLLLRAYAELPADLRSWHALRIVGSGSERDVLAALAQTLGLGPEVLVGALSRAEVATEFAGASVLVSTSAVETFGVTLIEALAAGVPFVATDSGGPRDIAGPGLGTIVDADDPGTIAAAIADALASPARVAADEARRDTAVARYGPAAVAAQLGRIYEAVRS